MQIQRISLALKTSQQKLNKSQQNLNWSFFNLQQLMDIMTVYEKHSYPRADKRLRVSRVIPRGPLAFNSTKPVRCILIDKEEICELYRYILNEPEWKFPEV